MPGQHVADASDATVLVAGHGEPIERERRPGTIPQQVFKALDSRLWIQGSEIKVLKVARHVAVDERDSDAVIDWKPAGLAREHVGGGSGVEQPSEPEPADDAAAHPFGDRGQMDLSDRPRWQERRRGVTACFVRGRHVDAVGRARAEVHMVVERRAEAVQEGDRLPSRGRADAGASLVTPAARAPAG